LMKMSIFIEKVLPLAYRLLGTQQRKVGSSNPGDHGLPDHVINSIIERVQLAKIPLHERNDINLTDETLSKDSGVEGLKTTWYFAFGSNLNEKVFEGRRGIKPIQVFPAFLNGYKLIFDLQAIPYLEPTMANLKQSKGDFVHGVAFRLTETQLKRLHESEGGPGNYALVPVNVTLYHKDQGFQDAEEHTVAGFTLVAPQSRVVDEMLVHHYLPSHRYVTIIRQGAIQRGLDPKWIEYLHSLPHSKVPSKLAKIVASAGIFGLFFCLIPVLIVYEVLLRWYWKVSEVSRRHSFHFDLFRKLAWGLWMLIPPPVRSWLTI